MRLRTGRPAREPVQEVRGYSLPIPALKVAIILIPQCRKAKRSFYQNRKRQDGLNQFKNFHPKLNSRCSRLVMDKIATSPQSIRAMLLFMSIAVKRFGFVKSQGLAGSQQ